VSPLPAADPRRTAPRQRPDEPVHEPAQQPGPIRVEPPLGRGRVERSPVPGHGPGQPGTDRFAERTGQIPLDAAVLLVASIVVGQLWALTVALDVWLSGEDGPVRWLLLFQALSFALSLAIWFATPRHRR
jgi:hypothetical protein